MTADRFPLGIHTAIARADKLLWMHSSEADVKNKYMPSVVKRWKRWWLLRETTMLSLPEIAAYTGAGGHSTVYHGINRLKSMMERYDTLRAEMNRLKEAMYVES